MSCRGTMKTAVTIMIVRRFAFSSLKAPSSTSLTVMGCNGNGPVRAEPPLGCGGNGGGGYPPHGGVCCGICQGGGAGGAGCRCQGGGRCQPLGCCCHGGCCMDPSLSKSGNPHAWGRSPTGGTRRAVEAARGSGAQAQQRTPPPPERRPHQLPAGQLHGPPRPQ